MEKFLCRVSLKTVHPKSHSLFPRAMSQSPKDLDECREGQIPRSLLRIKLDTPSACCGVFDCVDWRLLSG